MSYISFQPNDYFNTKLYTGNGSTNAITGVGFQPDWTWIKQRSATRSHMLFDAIRGATYRLSSDTNEANGQYSTSLTAFNTDGFTLGAFNDVNASSGTFASWNWKANGSGSSNTDGSINTTYTSANTTSGFSIIQYTGNGSAGATIGHGLGVAPKMFITKKINTADDWIIYHASLGATKYLKFNTTMAAGTATDAWNDTAPTSSVFSLGSASTTNGNGATFIAYAFAEKTGFSKFGSYTGNGNNDGSFIYLGFKPAFVLCKVSSGTTNDWTLLDNKRDSFNVAGKRLYPNTSGAESETARADFTANGFKLRGDGTDMNGSGNTYIYMAFAEAPLVGSNNVPATAR